jgi:hypothetical protein
VVGAHAGGQDTVDELLEGAVVALGWHDDLARVDFAEGDLDVAAVYTLANRHRHVLGGVAHEHLQRARFQV